MASRDPVFKRAGIAIGTLFVAAVATFMLLPTPNVRADKQISKRAADHTAHASVDCSAAYGGKNTSCVRVKCNKEYSSFLGTWKGTFHSYVRKQSSHGNPVYRPYQEVISYTKSNCMKNAQSGETFIIGLETSRYSKFHGLEATVKKDRLVFGKDADGTAFLRRVGNKGTYNYTLAYKNGAAGLSIWKMSLPASHGQPPMTFTTIDAKELTAAGKHKRNVAVTLKVGPANMPYWQGLITYGSHTRQEE
jgi:hypothetical protein